MKWFLERLLAAIVVAGLTGTIGAWIFTVAGIVGEGRGIGNVRDLVMGLLGLSALGFVYGAVLGVVPGVLVICLSRAKYRPWHAAPLLLIGTAIGVSVGITIATWGPFVRVDTFALWVIFATVGGILASLCVRKPRTMG